MNISKNNAIDKHTHGCPIEIQSFQPKPIISQRNKPFPGFGWKDCINNAMVCVCVNWIPVCVCNTQGGCERRQIGYAPNHIPTGVFDVARVRANWIPVRGCKLQYPTGLREAPNRLRTTCYPTWDHECCQGMCKLDIASGLQIAIPNGTTRGTKSFTHQMISHLGSRDTRRMNSVTVWVDWIPVWVCNTQRDCERRQKTPNCSRTKWYPTWDHEWCQGVCELNTRSDSQIAIPIGVERATTSFRHQLTSHLGSIKPFLWNIPETNGEAI